MKTFQKFKTDAIDQLNERYLTQDECRKAYYEGVKNGTIRNVKEAEEECPHCGRSNPEGEECHCWQSGHHNAPDVSEDEGGSTGGPMPTNAAGQGAVAGIGIQLPGEPNFAEPGVPVRRKLEIVGPAPVDPRMFANKIFGHSKLADSVKESEESHHDLLLAHGFVSKGNGKYVHPEGHEAQIFGNSIDLKGRSWSQSMPGHQNPKVFRKQLQKLNPSKNSGPKSGQSAMPDSKGRYTKLK
jgi:hypothetical protein